MKGSKTDCGGGCTALNTLKKPLCTFYVGELCGLYLNLKNRETAEFQLLKPLPLPQPLLAKSYHSFVCS